MFIWSMNYDQLVAWIKNEIKEQGISHQRLSDLTNIPKATIDAILAMRQRDVGHYTLSPIVRVLMKRYLASSPCRSAAVAAKSGEVAELQDRLKEYKETNATYRAVIADLRAQIKKLEAAAKKAQKLQG
jgi:hypothetical protein